MARVLIVEPDQTTGEAYAKALFADGFEVAYAQTAQAALAHLDLAKPDAIILDLELAEHNGIEFLQEFASYPEWQGIPIIVNSYLPQATIRLIKHDFPVAAITYKPEVTLQSMLRLVKRLVGKDTA